MQKTDMSEESLAEYYLGVVNFEEHAYDEALSRFRRSLELQPHFKTCTHIAKTLQLLGHETEAERYIVQAYSLNPKHSEVATEYAALLLKQNSRTEAITVLKQVLKTNNNYGPAKRLLASLETT